MTTESLGPVLRMSILRRISNLFARPKLQQEIDAEFRSHIEMRIEDNIAAGMSPGEQLFVGRSRFGYTD